MVVVLLLLVMLVVVVVLFLLLLLLVPLSCYFCVCLDRSTLFCLLGLALTL